MSNNYAGKFVSAETAVKAVQPGDWVDYGLGAGFPGFSTVRWQHAGMS
ncbi:MAG: hypothetical protein ACLR3S_11640 [Clostridium fessum]